MKKISIILATSVLSLSLTATATAAGTQIDGCGLSTNPEDSAVFYRVAGDFMNNVATLCSTFALKKGDTISCQTSPETQTILSQLAKDSRSPSFYGSDEDRQIISMVAPSGSGMELKCESEDGPVYYAPAGHKSRQLTFTRVR